MKHILIFLVFALAFVKPVAAQDLSVRDTIQSQLRAFSQDDYAQAFEYATPRIKRIFGDPARFRQMVEQGFPMVARQRAFTFKGSQNEGVNAQQDVLIEDMSGTYHLLRYSLILLNGVWKISAVERIPTGIVGA